MKILKNKIILILMIFVINFITCCKSSKVIEIKDPLGDWRKYLKIEIIDKTIVKKDLIIPHVILEISKVTDEILYSVTFDYYYEYGYKYFSKSAIEKFTFDSDEIRELNSKEKVIKEYKYEPCKKLKIEGYDDYDIYNPPKSNKVHLNNMIMFGLKDI